MAVWGLIGGTGLNSVPGLEVSDEHSVDTPWGAPSALVQEAVLDGEPVYFLARHGRPHRLAPHLINYRANVWALRELGVTRLLGVNAVGGINPRLATGALLIPDQLIDYTWGRECSFYDGRDRELRHIDFTRPYDPELCAALHRVATRQGLDCMEGGTYGITQGPRLETAAEIQRMARDGCDAVGMTGMPEAVLAAEADMRYLALGLVVNAAAGLGSEPITEQAIFATLERQATLVAALVGEFFRESASLR